MSALLYLDEDPLFWKVAPAELSWADAGCGSNLSWALPSGELDTQLESLLDVVWRCEAVAAVEDRIGRGRR